MKRLKMILSLALLLLALPLWRWMDMATWLNLNKTYSTVLLFSWSTLFLIVPISLVCRRFFIPALATNLCFAIVVRLFAPAFSYYSLDLPEARHCTLLHYSGFFYPFKSLMPQAHEDDLLIRNQICWIRKLDQSIPEGLTKHEMGVYKDLMEQKLLLPEIKWKSSLPFLIPLYLNFTASGVSHLEAQKFWNDHFTAEVKDREYNFLSYPHSEYIKWEYGLVEKYWSNFLDEVKIEETIVETN